MITETTSGSWELFLLFLALLFSQGVGPQHVLPAPEPPVFKAEVSQDPLGRTTPRGTVRGFLSAASKDEKQTAVRYLNTSQDGRAGLLLVDELFAVLNRRLHVEFNEISDQPEGSVSYSADPDRDLVGRVNTQSGDVVDIVVERIHRKDGSRIWLFSRQTLEIIPELYDEVSINAGKNGLLTFLIEHKLAHIPLVHWLAVFVGLPLFHFLGIGLNRLLSRLAGELRRKVDERSDLPDPEMLSKPVRLLLLAWLIRWAISRISLPLLARQFWSSIAVVIAIAACVWLLIRLSGWLENKARVRLDRRRLAGALSILRFVRSALDALIMFVGVLVLFHYFGIQATTALAGLGVGGIAIALAAQKTLENIIAGLSLISDKALRVGDFLRVGTALGTVTEIGLRSTRIRTLDRTVVNVPNGQIANVSLENLSLRDKFWFHHFLALTCETSAAQLRSVLAGLTDLLAQRLEVDKDTGHVRFLRFGSSSFDVEIFAYVTADDWTDFLKIQEQLLLETIQIVEKAGTRIALPFQIMYSNLYVARAAERDAELEESPPNMEWPKRR